MGVLALVVAALVLLDRSGLLTVDGPVVVSSLIVAVAAAAAGLSLLSLRRRRG